MAPASKVKIIRTPARAPSQLHDSAAPAHPQPKYALGAAAIMVGASVNYFGDRLLGVKLELFHGISTFSVAWGVDLFLVPFIAGLIVAWMFGRGAKWLAYVPAAIVRVISYLELSNGWLPIPPDNRLIPMGWWGFFLILAIESCVFGGIGGEVFIRKIFHRGPQGTAAADLPNPWIPVPPSKPRGPEDPANR